MFFHLDLIFQMYFHAAGSSLQLLEVPNVIIGPNFKLYFYVYRPASVNTYCY